MARRKIWVPELAIATTTAASVASSVNLLNNLPIDLAGVGGLTVSRIIGNVSVSPASIAVQAFSMAIGVFHEAQDAAEPIINVDISANLMWTWIGRTNGAFIETAAGVFTRIEERIYFDVRVQRKLQPNFVLSFLLQNQAGVSMVHTIGCRTLVSLP